MSVKTEVHNSLPEEAHIIRDTVFIKEQGFENEFDSIDGKSIHILLFENDVPVATCRIFRSDEMNCYVLGRLAVLKEYRGRGYGIATVREALNQVQKMGGKELMLHSQCRASGFYEKLGFSAFGETEFDEGCPHIWMKKEI